MVLEINTYDAANDPSISPEDYEKIKGWVFAARKAREISQQMMPYQDFQETEEHEPIVVTIDDQKFFVNPQQMNWSKEYKIEEAEIVYDKDITQWMGPKLWKLTINLKTFTQLEKDFLWYLGDEDEDHPGPHKIEAAIPTGSMCMYLRKKNGHQIEGESDHMWYWSLDFIECHDAGL